MLMVVNALCAVVGGKESQPQCEGVEVVGEPPKVNFVPFGFGRRDDFGKSRESSECGLS